MMIMGTGITERGNKEYIIWEKGCGVKAKIRGCDGKGKGSAVDGKGKGK